MATQNHVLHYSFLNPVLEKYKKIEGSCWCQGRGRFHLSRNLSPTAKYCPCQDYERESGTLFGLKDFYQCIGAESDERRKGKLKRGCFCWIPVHFSPSLIQSRSYLSFSTAFPISKLHSNPSRKFLHFAFRSCICS